MSPFSYDDFKSDVIKFNTVGQEVDAKILEIEPYTGMNNNKCFKYMLLLNDGRRASLICSQTDLKQKLADVAPQVGDQIHIKYIQDKHVGQPEPMKVFEVGVKSGEAAAPAPVPAATTTTDNDGAPF